MNIFKIRYISGAFISVVATSLSVQASAQDSNVADIGAYATLIDEDQQATIEAGGFLEFGRVKIPGPDTTICTYTVSSYAADELTQTRSNGAADECMFLDNGQEPSSFRIFCDPGRAMDLVVRTSNSQGITGVGFSSLSDLTSLDGNLWNEPQVCDASGESNFEVGGSLTVRGVAQPMGSDTQVGTVTVEVFY